MYCPCINIYFYLGAVKYSVRNLITDEEHDFHLSNVLQQSRSLSQVQNLVKICQLDNRLKRFEEARVRGGCTVQTQSEGSSGLDETMISSEVIVSSERRAIASEECSHECTASNRWKVIA